MAVQEQCYEGAVGHLAARRTRSFRHRIRQLQCTNYVLIDNIRLYLARLCQQEIGALDADLKPRANTWLKHASLLFIDNPVGSGFSYVDDAKYLATDNQQISLDLLAVLKSMRDSKKLYLLLLLLLIYRRFSPEANRVCAHAPLDLLRVVWRQDGGWIWKCNR